MSRTDKASKAERRRLKKEKDEALTNWVRWFVGPTAFAGGGAISALDSGLGIPIIIKVIESR